MFVVIVAGFFFAMLTPVLVSMPDFHLHASMHVVYIVYFRLDGSAFFAHRSGSGFGSVSV